MTEHRDDIWNDNDGEPPPKQPRRLRRFLIFALTLVLVLAVVLLAAWRDGTGFDALHRFFSYGAVESETDGGYHYDASANNRFALCDKALVVLSETALKVLDESGREVYSTPVKMKAPALASGGGRAVAYDVGGTALYVVDQNGLCLSLTAEEQTPFIAATLNADGWLAVTKEEKGYKGAVYVYDAATDPVHVRDADIEPVFIFHSSTRFVTDAYVSDDNTTLAAVTLGQENSVFVSNIVLYDLTIKDPIANYDISGGLVLDVGEQGGRLIAVSDTCLTLADWAGIPQASYAYSGAYLRGYAFSGDNFTALLLNRYQSGSVGRLVTVGADGAELASLDVNEEILSVSAAGRYLAVLYADSLTIYNRELQVYATLTGTDYAKEVLMRGDGSALLLSSEKAHLFLP
ncbi:MAG: DUF5711 family protein [Oscillibacter sp.]